MSEGNEKAKAVTFKGQAEGKGPGPYTHFSIDGVTLPLDQAIKVEDASLVKELQEGSSDRVKGFKFEVSDAKKDTPSEPRTAAGVGGPGGSAPAGRAAV